MFKLKYSKDKKEKKRTSLFSGLLAYAKLNKVVRRSFVAFAAVVIFATTYAMILPAITISVPKCGVEEHTHAESCYRNEKKLICKITDESHEHTDECYTEQKVLVCDKEVHVHSDEYRCPHAACMRKPDVIAEILQDRLKQADDTDFRDCLSVRQQRLLCADAPEEQHHNPRNRKADAAEEQLLRPFITPDAEECIAGFHRSKRAAPERAAEQRQPRNDPCIRQYLLLIHNTPSFSAYYTTLASEFQSAAAILSAFDKFDNPRQVVSNFVECG